MEKLLYLLPSSGSELELEGATAPADEELRSKLSSLAEHTRGLTVLTTLHHRHQNEADGAAGWAALFVWLTCVDRRIAFEHALSDLRLRADGYLLTESIIHGARAPAAAGRHATLVSLGQVPQLGQQELRVRLAALSSSLRARAASAHITRDYVVRPLHASAKPLRGLFTLSFTSSEAPLTSAELGQLFDQLGLTAQRSIQSCERYIARPCGR